MQTEHHRVHLKVWSKGPYADGNEHRKPRRHQPDALKVVDYRELKSEN